jgi:hypothetical protein
MRLTQNKEQAMNKKGELATIMVVSMSLIGLMTTAATIKTAKNGTLKNNGKLIWCKMMNKGNDFCDAQHR